MKALFADTQELLEPNRIPLFERYFRAMTFVATCWTVLASSLQGWALSLPADSKLHLKLEIFGIGSILIAAALYSVAIPLRVISKNWSQSHPGSFAEFEVTGER